ncbi:unnamed protein product [Rhizopus stolonifer]
MGNGQSDIKSRLSYNTLPKHLRPLPPKKLDKLKKLNKQYSQKTQVPAEIPDFYGHLEKQSQNDSGPRGAFRWLKGRRFFNHTSSCLLPNDQLELDRSRVQAFILRWVFGGVIAPLPLEKGTTVLNIGHGPGMWPGHHMIDLALDNRESMFVAVDMCDLLPDDFEQEEEKIEDEIPETNSCRFTPIHPNLSVQLQTMATPLIETSSSFSNSTHSDSVIETDEEDTTSHKEQPTKRRLLKNLDFYRLNVIEERLPFEDNQFDFVKQRLATASFTTNNWKHVLAEMVRVTKPGGWVGLLEIDFSMVNLGPQGAQFEKQMIEVTRSLGIEPRMAIYLEDLLKALGLEEIKPQSVSIPLGEWGMDLGMLWKNNIESFAESIEPFVSKLMNLSKEDYKDRWRVYFEEAQETKPFANAYAIWGKKPLDSSGVIDWSLCPVFNKQNTS